MDISEMETLSSWNQTGKPIMENKDKKDFYNDAAQYWSNIPPTVDGMLGGYGHISTADIQGSSQFLKQLFRLKLPPGKGRALDCGAGIGRITKNLLFNHFRLVDLVEQNPTFVAQARAALENHPKMGSFFCSGLQNFTPEPATYDVIWCQWVLGHLTDDDLLSFLNGCICGLRPNGIIVLKENTTTNDQLDVDATDSSVTRPLHTLCELLQRAGLRCVKQKRQVNFPHGLYPVYMIATRPGLESTTLSPSLNSGPVSIDEASGDISETCVKIQRRGDSKYEEMTALTNGKSELESKSSNAASCSLSTDQLLAESGSLDVETLTTQQEQRNDPHPVPNSKGTAVQTFLSGKSAFQGTVQTECSIISDDSQPEVYEQEASDFSHEVEYSSDDSTKTESSTADVGDPILVASMSEPPRQGFGNERKCDIA